MVLGKKDKISFKSFQKTFRWKKGRGRGKEGGSYKSTSLGRRASSVGIVPEK
jgi:hypothetical protein